MLHDFKRRNLYSSPSVLRRVKCVVWVEEAKAIWLSPFQLIWITNINFIDCKMLYRIIKTRRYTASLLKNSALPRADILYTC
jgi:hypothetical protein